MKYDFYVLLGSKIKERRKNLGLTQKAVCGDFITRNMLSRIENGSAHPSVDTMIYLSEKLDMPLEYFVCTNEKSEAYYKKVEAVKKARELFSKKDYKSCRDVCKDIDSPDDEIWFMISECEIKIALEHMKYHRLSTALEYLKFAEASSERNIYNILETKTTVKFYSDIIECVKCGKYPEPSIFTEIKASYVNNEFYAFAFVLSLGENNKSFLKMGYNIFSDGIYKQFIYALISIDEKNYYEAEAVLLKILNENPDFFTSYFSVSELEKCYRELEDYKKAYEYANLRLDMLEKFNK